MLVCLCCQSLTRLEIYPVSLLVSVSTCVSAMVYSYLVFSILGIGLASTIQDKAGTEALVLFNL